MTIILNIVYLPMFNISVIYVLMPCLPVTATKVGTDWPTMSAAWHLFQGPTLILHYSLETQPRSMIAQWGDLSPSSLVLLENAEDDEKGSSHEQGRQF